ncbi:MAG: bile acid:sodium symporter [Deltaproteobacteria bacterium]|nr:bile acid:sodium symporter [Deltaproteobacteria bacterium]
MPASCPTAPAPRGLALLNHWLARRSVGLLLGLVALNLLLPGPGIALKGVQLGRVPLTGWSYDFSTLALTLMMLSAAVQCRFGDFAELRRRPRACGASLLLVYLLGPALALAMSVLALGGFHQQAAIELRLGLFLIALMPVAMTAAVWVRLAAGNIALLLALIAVTTTLSVLSVPLYSQLMPALTEGALASVPAGELLKQLILSVSLPLALGLGLRRWAERWADAAQPTLTLLGNLGLYAALSTNVAGAAAHLEGDLELLALAGTVTVGLNLAFFGVALLGARRLRQHRPGLSHDDAVALLFGGGMRSTGTAMVLGSAAFPGMPLVTLPAAIYSISQQIFAGYLVRRLQPGAALLRTPVGRSRRELDLKLRQLVLAKVERLTLLVFRISAPRWRAAPLLPLMQLIRRRLRGHDFVSVLQHDHFAVLLTEIDEDQAAKVAERLEIALLGHAPALQVRWGIAEARSPLAASQLVDMARERALGLRCSSSPEILALREKVAS